MNTLTTLTPQPDPQPGPTLAAALCALDGWMDICRTGTFPGLAGEVTLTEADLDEMTAAHATQDPVPVVLGHPETDDPAVGWIAALRRTGDRLQARLERLDPGFRADVLAGRYGPRSIAAEKRITGWTLRHVGFLGAQNPAVDGLVPTRFAAPEGVRLAFSAPLGTPADFATPLGGPEERSGWATVDHLMRSLREWVIERSSIAVADRVLPAWGLSEIRSLGEPDESEMAALAAPLIRFCAPLTPDHIPDTHTPDHTPDTQETDMTGTPAASAAPAPAAAAPAAPAATPATPPPGDAAQLAAGQAQLAAERQALETDRLALAAAQRLQSAGDTVDRHIRSCRVLPGERDHLVGLFAALDDEQTTVSFSASDGVQTRVTPAKALEAFLGGLPKRGPLTTELAAPHQTPQGTDTVLREGKTPQHVALAARALMGADPTGQLTIDQAVRQVIDGGLV